MYSTYGSILAIILYKISLCSNACVYYVYLHAIVNIISYIHVHRGLGIGISCISVVCNQ